MGGFIPPQEIVEEAHSLGLKIGIYTIYDSREPSGRGCSTGPENCDPENKEVELFYHFAMGVDGIFVENVQEARELRLTYQYRVIDADSKTGTGAISRGSINLFVLSAVVIWRSVI